MTKVKDCGGDKFTEAYETVTAGAGYGPTVFLWKTEEEARAYLEKRERGDIRKVKIAGLDKLPILALSPDGRTTWDTIRYFGGEAVEEQ